MTSFVPHSRQAVAEPQSGLMTTPWYQWAQRIDDAVIAGALTREQAEVAFHQIAVALGSPDGTIEGIPPLGSSSLTGPASVEVVGVAPAQFVQLANDAVSPPRTALYGTGPTGKRGWQAVREGDGAALGSIDGALTIYALDPLAVYLTDPDGQLLTAPDGSPILAEGASTSQLPEGSNLYYTDARADARVDAGIDALRAEADPFPIYTTAAELSTAIETRAAVPAGYIDGLKLSWVAATSIAVSSGAAFIPAAGNIVSVPAVLSASSMSLVGSTFYHVYLYLNAGAPALDIVTTAPAVPYSGSARTKAGDASRRYLGSFLTDGTGSIWSFIQTDDAVYYDVNSAGTLPFRVLANGMSTAPAAVSVAACVPPTGVAVVLKGDNTASNVVVVSIGRNGPGGSIYQGSLFNGQRGQWIIGLDGSQFSYAFSGTPTGGGVYFDVIGYAMER